MQNGQVSDEQTGFRKHRKQQIKFNYRHTFLIAETLDTYLCFAYTDLDTNLCFAYTDFRNAENTIHCIYKNIFCVAAYKIYVFI
jgi:hypothetical protein